MEHAMQTNAHFTTAANRNMPWGFLAAISTLFLGRGLILMCLYPPLEGFDEHKHIAYVVHMSEQGAPPIYGQASIPTSLYATFGTYPHSAYGAGHLEPIGALDYQHFWEHHSDLKMLLADSPLSCPTANRAPMLLRAAFHPPLFYRLTAPLFSMLLRPFGFLNAIYTLRTLNLIIASLAVFVFLSALVPMLPDNAFGRSVLLVSSLLPIVPVYVTRVSPDAAALLFTAILFWIACRFIRPRSTYALVLQTLAYSTILGVGTYLRVNVLVMYPVLLVSLVVFVAIKALSWQKACAVAIVSSSAFLLITCPLFIHNYSTYGLLIPGQEGIRTIGQTVPQSPLWTFASISHIWTFLICKMVLANLWTSGWSFLHPPLALCAVFGLILALGFAGGTMQITARQPLFHTQRAAGIAACSLVLWCMVCAGAYLHALTSLADNGHTITTPSYYAVPGILPFLALVLGWITAFPRRVSIATISVAGGLFVFTEWYGLLFIAAPYWSATTAPDCVISRLTSIHPALLQPVLLPVFALAYVAVFRLCIKNSLDCGSRKQHSSQANPPLP